MDNLEERQREMRERNSALSKRKQAVIPASPAPQIADSADVHALKKQIAKLEKRVLGLEAENQRLRTEKTIVVERTMQKSGDTVREQRHNFFKYSNARRY